MATVVPGTVMVVVGVVVPGEPSVVVGVVVVVPGVVGVVVVVPGVVDVVVPVVVVGVVVVVVVVVVGTHVNSKVVTRIRPSSGKNAITLPAPHLPKTSTDAWP